LNHVIKNRDKRKLFRIEMSETWCATGLNYQIDSHFVTYKGPAINIKEMKTVIFVHIRKHLVKAEEG
jgi:hypothetical protein